MIKRVAFGSVLLIILMASTVAAQGVKNSGLIKVFWGDKELTTSLDAVPRIIDSRVYIPASLLQQAYIQVQLNKKTLSLNDTKTKYVKNLEILNSFRLGFLDYFDQLDQETVNVLTHVITKEEVDTTRLLGLLEILKENAKHPGVNGLAIIIDTPDGFTHTLDCAEQYNNAINSLLNFLKTDDEAELKAFNSERKKAIESYEILKNEYVRYINLSLSKYNEKSLIIKLP
ncbi:hypothetical protein SAMN05428962_2734 [Paenibacillus sp. BC26]|nr:hypothetical protein SAMN05428962_2734 [Paenibacillus sp. BC26]